MSSSGFRAVRLAVAALALLFSPLHSIAQATPAAPASASSTAQATADATQAQQPAYSLPPQKLAEAVAYSRQRTVLFFASTAWGILSLALLLWLRIPARLQTWAIAASRRRWVQGFVFTPLLLLALGLLSLPFDLYGQHLQLLYHQSVQHWAGWWWDWTKSQLLSFALTSLLVLLLFWIIRRSPQRWWFWFWLATLPIMLLSIFAAPLVIDPLFNKFEPLQKTDPALVAQLEKVAHHGGIHIPPDRMFLMRASAKVTGINAYVTGFGASKRVVVWDTAVQRATPGEISFIFGHEMGHYVLGHIFHGLLFAACLMCFGLWLGHRTVHWLLRRFGARWKISALEDWAALAVLMLVLSIFNFLSEPIYNSFSRMQEHAADVYGQEVIHGIVANPQQTAQQAFQLLGESYLEDPAPDPFVEFWTFNHPSVTSRATFAASYNPWVPGKHPKYFRK
jgi:Zn-dependent protease with chaperone function